MKRSLVLLGVIGLLAAGCESYTFPWKASSSPRPVAELEPIEGKEEPAPNAGGQPAPAPGLQPSGEQRFTDVPIPAGVTQDIERTYVYQSPDLEIGRLVYTSKAAMGELGQFYIKECPSSGWTLKNSLEAGGIELSFEKPGKRLSVTVRESGRQRLLVLNLTPDRNP